MNILYVEDDPVLRYSLSRELRGVHHTVYEADSAESALPLLAELDVDVLLTDVGLPGDSGDVLAAEARALRPDIRIVFCTGLDRFKLAGIGDFGPDVLRKPFTLDALLVALAGPASAERDQRRDAASR